MRYLMSAKAETESGMAVPRGRAERLGVKMEFCRMKKVLELHCATT